MRNEAAITAFESPITLDVRQIPRDELQIMAEAGQEIAEVYRVLAKTGDNVVGELLKSHETFYEWDHYPPGDVYDRESHAQFYYHAHPADQRFPGEHGHFHTFLRPRGMPAGVGPADVPGFEVPEDPDDALSHLIAVAMTSSGFPHRLFTVNRWVTGEVWYRAEDVVAMLDRFRIDHAQPSWPLNIWISAMTRLFKPQIVDLVRARDRTIADWARRHPDRDVFEDRALEVASYIDISVDDQIRAVTGALSKG